LANGQVLTCFAPNSASPVAGGCSLPFVYNGLIGRECATPNRCWFTFKRRRAEPRRLEALGAIDATGWSSGSADYGLTPGQETAFTTYRRMSRRCP
jgi:hypothetical protein